MSQNNGMQNTPWPVQISQVYCNSILSTASINEYSESDCDTMALTIEASKGRYLVSSISKSRVIYEQ